MADPKQALAPKNPVLAQVEASKNNLVARLPKGVDKARFFLGLITAIRKSKANAPPGKSLADCDPNSVLLAAYEAADVGCPLAPSLQMGWLINYGREAQFQPSYRFFIQKAYETGEVKSFFAEVVYEGDEFNRQYAPKKNLFHAPGDKNVRTKETAIGAYALVQFTDDTIDWEYLTAEQIGRHQKHSKQPNSLMWSTFFEEAWRKTPIRVIAKRLPVKNRNFEGLVEMIDKDAEADLITSEEIAEIAQPQRLSESKQAEQPKEESKQTAEAHQEPEKPKASAGKQPAMFSEEDPIVSAQEQSDFWNEVFEIGWGKPRVIELVKKNFGVDAVKDLKRSQLASTLSTIKETGA